MKNVVTIVILSLVILIAGCTSLPQSKQGTVSVTKPETQPQSNQGTVSVAKTESQPQSKQSEVSVTKTEIQPQKKQGAVFVPRGEIISVARLDADWRTGKGSSLSGLTVYLNEKGITADRNSKSGWFNVNTWGVYKNSEGLDKKVLLKNVCFWVNDGGKNWLDFSVEKALLDGNDDMIVTIATQIEELSKEENRPIIIIDGKYKLIPRLNSLSNITFVQE